MEVSRREFAIRCGAALAATFTLSGNGSAEESGSSDSEHADTKEEYVSLSYDKTRIEKYQPRLLTDGVEQEPTAFYATVVESEESDLDIILGFTHYLTQEGVLPTGDDSHYLDREPFYAYVDAATGDLVKAQYTSGHWYSNTEYVENFETDDTGNRPIARVVPKWHHYTLRREPLSDISRTKRPDVKNLLADTAYPAWLSNGLRGEIVPGAVYDAHNTMQGRESWWRDGAQTWQERAAGRFYLALGIRSGAQTDREGGLW